MDALVARCLRKIRSNCARKDQNLRSKCDEVLQQIGNVSDTDDLHLPSADPNANADKYFDILNLALKSPTKAVKDTVLDAIEKLIAYGYLRGNSVREDEEGNRILIIDSLINSVRALSRDSEQIQLQVIRVLLTAVTSNVCRVRKQSLLSAVGATYDIYVEERNSSVNRTTAKAALTQMVDVIIQRMEIYDGRKKAGLLTTEEELSALDTSTHGEDTDSNQKADSSNKLSYSTCMYPAVAQKLGKGYKFAESKQTNTTKTSNRTSNNVDELEGCPTVYHRDAFLLFRALCRLSKKSSESNEGMNKATITSTLLSLELLLRILEHAGQSFRTGERFLASIRQFLCTSLLSNSVHPVSAVVSISLQIFQVLVKSFKTDLLPEIEVFVSNVFLRILESPNVDHEQKVKVLEVFNSLCHDESILVELFLNYDCISNRGNVFERVVTSLGSIAQGRASDAFNASQKNAMEASRVHELAMKALSGMLNCMTRCTDEAHASAVEEENRMDTAANTEADIGAAARIKNGSAADSSEDVNSNISPTEDTSNNGQQRKFSQALATNYDRLKKRRQLVDKAALKFRMKPRSGVSFMIEQGLMKDTATGVAAGFHELREELDKTAIGEYLGEDKQFNLDVLHAYVDLMDFSGMRFDEAIRHFLSGFRLPGEAQKIDRMMEKFAERYTAQNPEIFPSPDTAFILAYSVIMLQTDAHNPSIKPERKMTKDAFISNNRGIADGRDLPRAFLSEIYDSIVEKAISLREDDQKRIHVVSGSSNNAKLRREAFHVEKADILKTGEAMMMKQRASAKAWRDHHLESGAAELSEQTGGVDETLYYTFDVMTLDHIRAMFDVAWGPILAVLSVNFETMENPTFIKYCIDGLREAVHISGRLGMGTERDAFVSTLAKFTLLDQPTRQMRPKNNACVEAIVDIALNEGRYLGDAWGTVLLCISNVARLHNVAAGGVSDDAFFAEKHSKTPNIRSKNAAERAKAEAELAAIERFNASYACRAVDEPTLLRIFTESVRLETRALQEFVGHLCRVSLFELHMGGAADELFLLPQQQHAAVAGADGSISTAGASSGANSTATTRGQSAAVASARRLLQRQSTSASNTGYSASPLPMYGVSAQPRVFSLQKVVEIADYNMASRPRVLWAQVWDQLSRFFTAVGCHSNAHIAMFAIDSLKQLSYKFLSQGELKHFPFQTKFLAPFHAIMEAQPRAAPVVRELILQVFANIVRGKAAALESGWQTLFAVHAAAATDSSEAIVSLAFDTVHVVLNDQFARVAAHGAFEDLVKCLVCFAGNDAVPQMVSVRAVDHLASVGTHLARGRIPLYLSAIQYTAEEIQVMESESTSQNGVSKNNRSSQRSTFSKNSRDQEKETLTAENTTDYSDKETWYDLDGRENKDVVTVSVTPPLGASGFDTHNPIPVPHDEEIESIPQQGNNTQAKPIEFDGRLVADDHVGGYIHRFDDRKEHLRLWWPLLTGLAGIVGEKRLTVRTRALEALFALLRRYGPGFSQGLWSLIYSGVLLPLFDDVRHVAHSPNTSTIAFNANVETFSHRSHESFDKGTANVEDTSTIGNSTSSNNTQENIAPDQSWLKTTCMAALSSLVRLQSRFFQRLTFLLPELFHLLSSCIDQEIEGLARIGVACLQLFLAEAGPRFDEKVWTIVIDTLGKLFQHTLPTDLLDAKHGLLGKKTKQNTSPENPPSLNEPLSNSDTPINHETDTSTQVTRQPSIPQTVYSPFGPAQLEHVREDGVSILRLPWGLLYAPSTTSWHVGPLNNVTQSNKTTQSSSNTQNTMNGVAKEDNTLQESKTNSVVHNETTNSTSRQNTRQTKSPESIRASLPFNTQRVVTQCVVQLELISSVGILADGHLSSLTSTHLERLVELLEMSAEFARNFNADRELRHALWKAGFMRFARHNNKLPSLLRQETSSTMQLLMLLLKLYRSDTSVESVSTNDTHTTNQSSKKNKKSGSKKNKSADKSSKDASATNDAVKRTQLAVHHLQKLSEGVVWRYSRLDEDAENVRDGLRMNKQHGVTQQIDGEIAREASAYSPLVLSLLDGFQSFSSDEFAQHLPWMYPLLVQLIQCGNYEVRRVLRTIFSDCVQTHLPGMSSL